VKILPVLCLLLASTALADTLAVQTSTAPVVIRPGANGFVALPALAIDTAISAACRASESSVCAGTMRSTMEQGKRTFSCSHGNTSGQLCAR